MKKTDKNDAELLALYLSKEMLPQNLSGPAGLKTLLLWEYGTTDKPDILIIFPGNHSNS